MRSRRNYALLALFATSTVPVLAVAQSPTADEASRRVLLQQAQQANSAGDHVRALDLVQRAARIRMTPSLRRFTSEQHLALNHPREALAAAELCLTEAAASADAQDRAVHTPACNELRTQASARVGKLRVTPPSSAPPGLTVRVAGEPLSDVLLGADSAVNPGAVLVEASAPGYLPFRREVQVASGARAEVTIALVHEAPPLPPPVEHLPPVSAGPFVLMGVGVASGIASGVMFGLRNGAVGNCAVEPDVIACPNQTDADRASAASGYHWASVATFSASVAFVGGGLLWLVIDRATARPSRRTVVFSPLVTPTGIGLAGQF